MVRRALVESYLWPTAVVLLWGLGGAMIWLRLRSMLPGDFQWSGARMLGQGVDPYLVYFQYGSDGFLLAQNPNYLPLLYVLLVPLGLLSFHTASTIWAAVNIVMALATAHLLGRAVGLGGWPLAGLTGLMLVSEPFSVALGNGQLTFVVLFFAVLAQLTSRTLLGGGAYALVLMKYSFAPLLLVPLVRRRWRVLAVVAAVELAALGVFCQMTGSNLTSTIFAPLEVAHTGTSRGAADVMTLSARFGTDRVLQFVLAAVTIGLLTWAARHVIARAHWVDALSACAVISLIALPHLEYDYLALLPVAFSGLRLTGWHRVVVLAPIAALWFGWFVGGVVVDAYQVPGIIQSMGMLLVVFTGLVTGVAARDLAVQRAQGVMMAEVSR